MGSGNELQAEIEQVRLARSSMWLAALCVYLVFSLTVQASDVIPSRKERILPVPPMPLTISSPAFSMDGDMPRKYTGQGQDVSPPLHFSGVPAGTKSLVLINDDPDAPDPAAPRMVWVHWVLYNIPPDCEGLPEGGGNGAGLPAGTLEGLNDWKKTGYRGPMPPIGRHRYFFKLYALKDKLPNLHKPTKAQVESAMSSLILEQSELIGTYQKS
eukprot:NODE_1639_length_804_cov_112.263576_g1370_i0.p1 GENE.NODE_1639_length_804_cov_112.263576_g1370_i0~~NODE_1639_length_804_cov_112.263576_g1370_i0.p1  ORF type:complete len:226 (-),score=25.34 NODE_1639_length_804_cov_112.263576_g1370_i0:125-763(-)